MKKLTANKVAQHLDISVVTLSNWYKWQEGSQYEKPKDFPKLPEYERHGSRGARYWNEEDLPQLEEFQKWIPKGRGGVMGQVSSKFWGAKKVPTKKG